MQISLAGLLAFGESALGLGVVLPGEVAIVALASSLDATSTGVAMIAVALGAVLGDHVGYFLGRRFGPKLAKSSVIRRLGVNSWDTAAGLMLRYGVAALLVSRLLPFVRTVMPAVAGAARLGYGRFLTASVVGSSAWAVLWVGTGGVLNQADLLSSPLGLAIAGSVCVALLALSRWVLARLRVMSEPDRDAATVATDGAALTTGAD